MPWTTCLEQEYCLQYGSVVKGSYEATCLRFCSPSIFLDTAILEYSQAFDFWIRQEPVQTRKEPLRPFGRPRRPHIPALNLFSLASSLFHLSFTSVPPAASPFRQPCFDCPALPSLYTLSSVPHFHSNQTSWTLLSPHPAILLRCSLASHPVYVVALRYMDELLEMHLHSYEWE
jgi:hypothetical protein